MFKIDCKDIDYILAISKHGNISKAAAALSIKRQTLQHKLRKYDIR